MKETVLLTGHSRGLGKAILRELEVDYNVVGISSKELDLSKPCDVAMFDTPKTHHLICNAGIAYDDLITNLDLVKLEKMINVNLISSIVLTRHIIRDMLLYDIQGSITFIGSISAHTGFKGLSMYGATKGALESFSRGIAREWGRMGIRCNTVTCGFMDTDMSGTLSSDKLEKIINRSSLKKTVNPADVALAVRHCMENKSLTGQTIIIDGGSL